MVEFVIHSSETETPENMDRNRRVSPFALWPVGSGSLAVVGGGKSVADCLDELRDWDGDIWAVNQTSEYLRAHNIDCWAYSVDPSDLLCNFISGKGILADHCHISSFDALDEIRKVDGFIPGPTSACAASYLGIKAGYEKVFFYGCDGDYKQSTHVYRDEPVRGLVRIDCDGGSYLTSLGLILQSQFLANIINMAPDVYFDRSGGLLAAMVRSCGKYDVTHVAPDVHYAMEKVA